MLIKIKTGLFAGLAILAVAGLMAGFAWITRPKPVSIEMDSPVAVEAKALVKRMYLLEGNIICVPGTSADVLAKVMVDSSDYNTTSLDRDNIERVYGKQALAHAGLLTSKQAYYASRDLPAPTTSNPGLGPTLRPTAKPVYLCSPEPENRLDELMHYLSVSQAQDGRVFVRYDYGGGELEATERLIDREWKITSIKLIKWHGP